MGAALPILLQVAPLVPGFLESLFKLIDAVRSDPATPEDAKATLDKLDSDLHMVVERVKHARRPK